MRSSAPIRPAWAYSALQRRSFAASASHSAERISNAALTANFVQAGREESAEKNGESYERSGDAICRP